MALISDLLLNQRYWEIFSISENSSIEEACKILHKNKIGALLVYCGESNDPDNLVGIITERDVIEDISLKGPEHLHSKIQDIMSSSIVKVSPGSTTDEALNMMIDNQIRHLAVMENEKLLGVVSMRDIVKKST
ncbi:MAG: CBS domain-containing protein [Pseudomonadota bacterium]|jgi:CBS domain-containing protein|nr:CBS domain-containing protein [Pseudomonadota bacterium]MEC8108272.1 CBS domain-containing protein [Pseudomonadota bacterium]MEC8169351.1 CBS domain-containing protein [Pseudomonadota bacterium]MEC8378422.1 CBS domain-containing protein [Pseudomonadota bacterium]MEC9193068.1 CBS domain-containing protein [Pseudomonadota bacterium]|tara:strand:+ start:884 stop:1282 length:399 start_codon:yes stop_codon:yes gene_type:complete